jgi:uncharacterized peroxidase-related enzyme
MAFIRTIPPGAAHGAVAEMYEQVRAEYGGIPNWAQAFSLRPAARSGWAALIAAIRANLSVRAYELATLAAARALRSTYCSLAHGRVLADQVFDPPAVTAIMRRDPGAPLEPKELAMMAYVEKIVRHADQVTENDIAVLRSHGYTDEEIFDFAAAAAARCFFSKLIDALGIEPDAGFGKLDPVLREALTIGRPLTRAE